MNLADLDTETMATLTNLKVDPFPAHWGKPPKQWETTLDIRKLPGNYGYGGKAMTEWIKANMLKDQKMAKIMLI